MAALTSPRPPLAVLVLAAMSFAPAARAASPDAGPAGISAIPLAARDTDVTIAGRAIEQWRPLIVEAARRFEVPQSWIVAVMRAESAGRTQLRGRPIVSRAGAMGLMQLMPGTWAAMRDMHALGSDPHAPRDNIMAGTAYLRAMYDRFGYPGLFAAYNAGPARYEEHLRTGRALPGETRAYARQVVSGIETEPTRAGIVSGTGLFFALGTTPARHAGSANKVQNGPDPSGGGDVSQVVR